MSAQLAPVTRLIVSTVHLKNGTSFQLVTDLTEAQWNKCVSRWSVRAKRPTAMDLVMFIRNRHHHCIICTKEQYDEVTRGKSVPATRAEWEAENPGKQ